MVAPFADPPDLAQFLGTATQAEADAGDPNVLDTAMAQRCLQAATDTLVAVCGWSITRELGKIVNVPPARTILLPTLYLTAVGSVVTSLGATVNPDLYYFEEWGEVKVWGRWDRPAINLVIPRWDVDRLTVTFDHGYTAVPGVVKTVCLEIAASDYMNPLNLASSSRLGAVDVYRRTTDALHDDARLEPYLLAAL